MCIISWPFLTIQNLKFVKMTIRRTWLYLWVHGQLARWIKWRTCDIGEAKEGLKNCDIGEAMEGLENELWHRWSDEKVGKWAEQRKGRAHSTFSHFTNVTTHSPTLLSLYLCHSSLSNLLLLHIHHSSFSNPSFASTSQVLQLIHLASRLVWTSSQL